MLERDQLDDLIQNERMRINSPRAYLQGQDFYLSVANNNAAALGQFTIKPKLTSVVAQRLILTRYAAEIRLPLNSKLFGDGKVAEHVPVEITHVLQCGHSTRGGHLAMKTEWASGRGLQGVPLKPANSKLEAVASTPWHGISTLEENQRAQVSAGERGLRRTSPCEDAKIDSPNQEVARLSTGGTRQRSLCRKPSRKILYHICRGPPAPPISSALIPRGD